MSESPEPSEAASSAPAPLGGGGARGAQLVAAGILLSKVFGLVRERAFAHYFGNSDAGDAFKAALKIPNFLQNLFGEGVLSASFIPVYARLLAKGDPAVARRLASAVATLLALLTSVLCLLGVLVTPFLIDTIAPGFTGEKRLQTIRLVQIFFPGVGLLVMSAWCLGILNSHRRFFLSYAAPVLWNVAIIAALFWFGGSVHDYALAEKVAWGLVVGSALQFAVQVPLALRLVGGVTPQLALALDETRTVLRNFLPVVASRGVVQLSAYVDNVIASLLPSGAVSVMAYAQTLYLLPISVFGMSVSAAQLPAMASVTGTPVEVADALRAQLDRGLRQVAFFIVPSVVALMGLGDVVVAALYQGGAFDEDSTRSVWAVLAGASLGMLAATQGRLYASAFYALGDTRTPFRFAAIRVALTICLGAVAALLVPGWLGVDARWGTVGLSVASGLAGWVEFLALRAALNRRIGTTGLVVAALLRLWGAALPAAAVAFAVKLALGTALHPTLRGVVVLGLFGAIYVGIAWMLGVAEARSTLSRVLARVRRPR
ncbi:lipid II flippase MurJ [Deltaproteobacteria bacterium]|nr:lipid II flippase MurJ [Deltaproteobacteria bacterium]